MALLEIKSMLSKTFIGLSQEMTLAEDRTPNLFQRFMPIQNNIKGRQSNDIYLVNIYSEPWDYNNIDIHAKFTKFAGIVSDAQQQDGFETFELPAADYAIFNHVGGPQTIKQTFDYIFLECLPNSGYKVAFKPHFEVLGEKYKHGDPISEELIFIPVKQL